MTTSTSAASDRTSMLLNRLIVACNDGARAHAAAVVAVKGAERKYELEDGATRRRSFAIELGEMVRGLGGTPSPGGSAGEDVRTAAHWVHALLFGENSGDAYGTCARVEAHAEKLYVGVMKESLSDSMLHVVTRQHDEIAIDRVMLHRRSMGG